MKKNFFSIRKITLIGILSGISIILGLTPLGFIPLGPVNYTIMHIPVIIGAIAGGPIVGAFVGLIFGLFSLLRAMSAPTIVSVFFLNPLVSVIPRILIGLVSYYVYKGLKTLNRKFQIILIIILASLSITFVINKLVSIIGTNVKPIEIISYSLLLVLLIAIWIMTYLKFRNSQIEIVASAALGSLTNTILVLTSIYVFHGKDFAQKLTGSEDAAGKLILGIGIANGIPEMLLSMIIVSAVVMALISVGQIDNSLISNK